MRRSMVPVAFAGLALLAALPAAADPIADFYHGKTLTMIVGTSAGNDYDYRARLVARFMGHHIPGEPSIVPRNMPGAGGVVAANDLATIEPHDGTVLHMIMSNMMANQAMALPGIKFDTRKFFWIGNTTSTPNVMVAWHTTGVTTIEQAKQKQLTMGAPTGTAGVTYVEAMNALVGTKFKLVTGYLGSQETFLAMESGEAHGRCGLSYSSLKTAKPDWLPQKKIVILAQIGVAKNPEIEAPLLLDLLAKEEDKQLVRFLTGVSAMSRPFVAPPGLPADRTELLRRAFDATMKDPEFLAEAKKIKADVDPSTGEQVQKLVDQLYATPKPVVERAKKFMGPG
jgi:tripartite-type tricarboxylate transporter receptor subunit TctC